MITLEALKEMAAAIRVYDNKLTEDEAGEIAAAIGDTPVILDGMVQGRLRGEVYEVPAEVLFSDG